MGVEKKKRQPLKAVITLVIGRRFMVKGVRYDKGVDYEVDRNTAEWLLELETPDGVPRFKEVRSQVKKKAAVKPTDLSKSSSIRDSGKKAAKASIDDADENDVTEAEKAGSVEV